MPSSRLQLRPFCTLPVSVDYALRFAKNSSSMAFLNPLFPGSSNCLLSAAFFHRFLSCRTFTDVARLGTFPSARVPTPQVTSRLSLLFARSLKLRVYPIIHCEVNCTFTTCYSLQFRTIHVCICWFTGKHWYKRTSKSVFQN